MIEINSETDFVAKKKDFIEFCKDLSDINFDTKGNLEKLKILCPESCMELEKLESYITNSSSKSNI